MVCPSPIVWALLLHFLLKIFDELTTNQTIQSNRPNAQPPQIGLVSQEPLLFSGTISDNIRFGNAGATAEQVWMARDSRMA